MLKRYTVLVVDDELFRTQTYIDALTTEGIEVIFAQTVLEARNIISNNAGD